MKSVNLWNYTIYEDGRIIGIRGKEINKNKEIKIKWGEKGVLKFVSYARFVYYAFNSKSFDFNNKSLIIRQKNNDENDYSIDNLIVVERKNINQGEKNALARITDKQAEEIRRIYNSSKNKRNDLNSPNVKISYRKLAEKYGVSHSAIMGIVKGTYRNKEKYVL